MEITLNYWTKATDGRRLERIYVNDADADGDAVGYFEVATTRRERGADSYYDRHRICKGDLYKEEPGEILWYGPDGAASAILDALLTGKVGLEASWREARERDPWGLWRAMQEKSRGFKYYVASRPKTERDKQIAAANKARSEAVYEVALP